MEGVEELRRAAQTLRERAQAADPHPWKQDSSVPGDTVIFDRDGEWTTNVGSSRTYTTGVVCFDHDEANGVYIATMHPGVGLALADVLSSCADCVDRSPDEQWDVIFELEIALSRLINGGAS